MPPRSPGFIISPRMQRTLAPEQLKLRDLVQAGDSARAGEIMRAAPAGGAVNTRRLWANTTDEQGFTLLMEAVALSEVENSAVVIKVLLEHGANVRASDEDGYTALHWAAACDNQVAVPVLVEAGAEINLRCTDVGETPLHRAARVGHVDAIEALQAC
jgi:ankyrin